ncbi:ATP dependent DNA ligase region, partial [Ostertagia ostertagi]
MGLEGMIAKRTDSLYREGTRNGDWLKIKSQQTEEVLICGFTAPKGARKKFGSLILGRYNGKDLIFCGHTGTGFSDKSLVELYGKMEPLITSESPFAETPKTNDKATWIKPELIAEIKFTELTKDHIFRHPKQRKPGLEAQLSPAPKSAPLSREGKLKGKTALVTGGDSGIGKATALLFAKEGANLVIAYLSEVSDAKQTKKEVQKLGGKCILIKGDLGKENHCKKVIAKTIAEFVRSMIVMPGNKGNL